MDRARRLADRFGTLRIDLVESADAVARDASILVNATPVGLSSEAVPVAIEALAADAAVLDLAYRPGKTALVRGARARGLRAQDGLRMLVEQGALAFERWFSQPADVEVMWEAAQQAL